MFEYDAFISYSSKDKIIVHALAKRLKQDGLRVWLDEWNIQPGDSIPLKIQQGLERSHTLLMCMSPAYFVSEWTRMEHYSLLFRDPINTHHRLIPLLIADCTRPDIVAHLAYIDWRTHSDNAYNTIFTSCREREEEKKREEKGFLERQQLEEQERKRKEEEKARREKEKQGKRRTEEKARKEKEEPERIKKENEKKQEESQRPREEAEQKQREEERRKEPLEGKKLEKPRDTQEIKEAVSVSSGKIQGKEKVESYLKYAKVFWSVLVIVLALVAAAYLGSSGDHATAVPLAGFNTNVTGGYAPIDVQFTSISENATSVNWNFGDGNNSTEQNPEHTYFTPGKYTVNLTASNGNITNSTLTKISVSAAPLIYIDNWLKNVSVINTETDTVIAKINISAGGGVAITPDGSKMYMVNLNNKSISVIDTATNTITSNVFVGSCPCRIAVTPDGTKVYVTNDDENLSDVSVIDTATDTIVTRVNMGSVPFDVAVTPDGMKVYVTSFDNTVYVIDTATNTVTATLNISTATVNGDTFEVTISPDRKKAYLINQFGDAVYVIDTVTNTITATITAGGCLSGVLTPDGTKMYVASYDNNNVSVIDTATNTVIASMNVGKSPYAIEVTPDGKKVYVANLYSNDVSVIDTATNTVTAKVPVGKDPEGIAVTPDGKKVYVANSGSATIYIIDTATNTVTAKVPVGQNPIKCIAL